MQQILEDIQGRLVYRMQTYIRTDIEGYIPTDEDLDYPGKLIRAGGSGSRSTSRQSSVSGESGSMPSMCDLKCCMVYSGRKY